MAVRKEGEKTKTGRQIEGEKNKKKAPERTRLCHSHQDRVLKLPTRLPSDRAKG